MLGAGKYISCETLLARIKKKEGEKKMLVVMELPVSGNKFVDKDGNYYILAHICDDGEKYPVLVNLEKGDAYLNFVIMREP